MGEINVLTYLEKGLIEAEKKKCFNSLVNHKFLVFNYDTNQYENSSIILEEYFVFNRLSLRYCSENFVINCELGKDYLTYLIDGNTKDAEIVVELTDDWSNILKNFRFSYIDNSGDNPSELDSIVEMTDIKILFKYNYFGKKYIDKFGNSFFRNFPAKKIDFLNETTVKLILVDNLFENISETTKSKIENYLLDFGISDIEFYDSNNYRY
jgi:hypothetical protein